MPVIQLELDSKGAISSLQKFDKAVDATSSNTTSKFSTIVKSVAAVGVVVGVAAIAVAKVSIEAAARMEEAGNKYNVVFEGMTDTVDTWVQALQDDYALSEYAATEYLASTKAIIDGTNMQSTAAANLSKNVVLLAQDLASFHDKSPEQAVRAMTSALTGEYEAMKQFGVVLKKAEIDQQAMLENDLKSKDAITNAMVAQAAYNLIIQKSGKAIGDTIRSQDTYTFQLKQAEALIMNLKVAIGEHLLPYATEMITTVNNWVKANEDLIGLKLDEFFENMGQMIRQVGQAAMWTYDRLVAFSNSLALFELAGSDQLSWFEFATMNAKEAAEFLDKHRQVVEEDTEALKGNTEASKEYKTSLDEVNAAVERSSSLASEITGKTKEVAKATSMVAEVVDGDLLPSEKELKEELDKVMESAKSSTDALNTQTEAANKVADAVNNVADANQRTSATSEGTYSASKAWSGGSSSMGSAPAMTEAEMDLYKSMTPAGRGDHYFNSGSSSANSGIFSDGSTTHDNLDQILLQKEAALAKIFEMRQGNGGEPVTNIYNFNQQISVSDITTITDQQTTNEARA